jgi:hypothetical protein
MTKITLLLITMFCIGCTQAIAGKPENASGERRATFAVT